MQNRGSPPFPQRSSFYPIFHILAIPRGRKLREWIPGDGFAFRLPKMRSRSRENRIHRAHLFLGLLVHSNRSHVEFPEWFLWKRQKLSQDDRRVRKIRFIHPRIPLPSFTIEYFSKDHSLRAYLVRHIDINLPKS